MPVPDYTDHFNTQLDPAQERKFQSVLLELDRARDLADYDMRGAYKAGLLTSRGAGHMPDTYKKPNHPTFSSESMYHAPEMQGGQWTQMGDKWKFMASPWNIRMFGAPALQQYFQQFEPGNTLEFQQMPALQPPAGVVRG